jgi:DNA polymerase III epsilon subunit-like protein
MTNWTTLRYAVADVEGNGQQPPELVELAVVPIAGGAIQAPASWLVKPERPITHFASRIHGITTPDVTGKPAFGAIANEVRKALDAPALVAHNAHVDVAVLERELDGWQAPEVFDTLKLARRLLPNQPGYRLGQLVRALNLAEGLPDGLTPHRASYDALVTARLFIHLATLAGSLEVLRGQPPEKAEEDALF